MTYTYYNTNPFDGKITYSNANVDFVIFENYFTQRNQWIINNTYSCFEKIDSSLYDSLTLFWLIEVFENINSLNFELNFKLNQLIKKMNVFQRIDELYSFPEFKTQKKKYSNMEIYLLLHYICLIKFELTQNWMYLDCCLKISDLLTSLKKTEISPVNLNRLSFLISNEVKYIAEALNG
jgi:hypothetical protein